MLASQKDVSENILQIETQRFFIYYDINGRLTPTDNIYFIKTKIPALSF